jgi:serine/threonine protein kinase
MSDPQHPTSPTSFPVTTDFDPEEKLAEAFSQFLDLQDQGENPEIEAFCERFPDLQPALRHALETCRQIDQAFDEETLPTSYVANDEDDDIIKANPFPGYKLLRRLGSGGMGRVYLAEDEHLRRPVAIKVLLPAFASNPSLRHRFLEEARALAKLSHPNIASIYSLGEETETPYFIMEYVEGLPLSETARALPLQQKMHLFYQVLEAAAFLHDHHLVHRDLKPANILVNPQLVPKILDFGLAKPLDDALRQLTQPGQVIGTPDYLSPEQARAEAVNPSSDVFSLGVILYELLTGRLPFTKSDFSKQIQSLSHDDPEWPHRINPSLPRGLQDICLKALEKNPSARYRSARDMAEDLARFLAGESVLAMPSIYTRHLSGKIEQHMRELESWNQEEIISRMEFDSLRRRYDRLIDREDAWIMEMRQLTFSQVTLYLGGWVMTIGAVLLVLFNFQQLNRHVAVLTLAIASGSVLSLGLQQWHKSQRRIGIAFLLTFTLLFFIGMLVMFNEYRWFTDWSQGRENLEFLHSCLDFEKTTNAQLWWALLSLLPVCYALRRYTKASVFSLELTFMSLLLAGVTLLRMGMLDWWSKDPGRPFLYLIPLAIAYFVAGYFLERLRLGGDSRYLYGHAVFVTYFALSGIAFYHQPYAQWLKTTFPWTRGQVEYLFIINALLYWVLQYLYDHASSPQLLIVAKAFRFVIAGHILMPLWVLSIAAMDRWHSHPAVAAYKFEARLLEVLLPLMAALFIYYSIARQMKNYFASGMLFLAVGIIRLEEDWLKGRTAWPMSLLIIGFLLMMMVISRTALLKIFLKYRRR